MNKCKNCGMEFVGKFCPECGAKLEESSVCPNCGSTVVQGSRFCNLCGTLLISNGALENSSTDNGTAFGREQEPTVRYDNVARSEQATSSERKPFFSEGVLSKVHTALKYLPVAFFVLYSLLMFAFFAADVAYFEADGVYSGKLTENFGTVYTDITNSISDITGCIVALYLFAFGSLALSMIMTLTLFIDKFKNKTTCINKHYIAVNDLLVYISFVLYFIFFIIAIAMMAIVSSFSDGIDEICIGGAPKLILSFAIIFGVFSATAKISDRIICKKFPQICVTDTLLREKSIADKIAADEKKRERRQEINVRIESEVDAFDNNSTVTPIGENIKSQDICRATGGKMVCLGGKPVFRKITSYVKFSRVLLGLGITAIIVAILGGIILWLAIVMRISRDILFYSVLGVFAFYVLIGMLCAIPSVNWWDTTEIRRLPPNILKTRREKTKTIGLFIGSSVIWILFMLIGLLSIIMDASGMGVMGYPTMFMCSLLCMFDIAGIIACTILKSRKKQLAVHFFGVEKPNELTPEKVPFDLKREKEFAQEFKHNKSIVAGSIDGTALYKVGTLRSVMIVLIILSIVTVICVFNVLLSPFRASYVSLFEVKTHSWSPYGYSYESGLYEKVVIMLIGEPDIVESVGNNEIWGYFDGDYLSVYKRVKELKDQMEYAVLKGDMQLIASLTLQLEQLRNSVRNTVYKSLLLYFEYGFLTEIKLDTCARGDGTAMPKTPVSTRLECDEIFMSALPKNTQISYSSSYTDGSYRYSVVLASAISGLTVGESGMQAVTWSDDWATYSANVIGVNSVRWKYGELDYTVEYVEQTGRVSMTISGNIKNASLGSAVSQYAALVDDLILNLSVDGDDTSSSPTLNLSEFGSLENVYFKKSSDYIQISNSQCSIWSENTEIPNGWSIGYLERARFGDEWELVDGMPHIVKERSYIENTYVCGDITIKFAADGRFELTQQGYDTEKGKYVIIGDKIRMDAYYRYDGTIYDNKIVIHGSSKDYVFMPTASGDASDDVTVDAEELKDTVWSGEIIEENGAVRSVTLSFNMFGDYILQIFRDQVPVGSTMGKYSVNGSSITLVNGSKTIKCIATKEGIKLDLGDNNYIILKKV